MAVHSKSYLTCVCLNAAVVVGAAVLAGCGGSADRAACDKPFDVAAWERASSSDPRVDGRTPLEDLADGLIDCETLIGASRSRVRALLGKPDIKDRETDKDLAPCEQDLVVQFDGSRVDETRFLR